MAISRNNLVSSAGADGVNSGTKSTVGSAYNPTSTSSTGKGQNLLDNYFRGIDRKGLIASILTTVSHSGQGWNEEEILNSEGITLSRLKSKVLNVSRININKTPSQVDFTNFGKMFAFFTKPDLNLFVDNKHTINPTIVDNNPDLFMRIVKNFPVAQSLQMSLGKDVLVGPGGGLLHLLGNMCSDIQVPDIQMSVEQGPKNMKEFGISYLGDMWESLQEGDIEISFIDTRDGDVAALIEMWVLYGEGIRNGSIFKKAKYINNNIIDYASSLYIMVVDESLNIRAHIAMIGVFPRSINTALLNYKATQLTAQDFIGPFSYTWHVSHISKPNAHHVVQMFNYVSGYTQVASQMGDKVAHQLMYQKLGNGYYHHTGITMDTGFYTEYPYHFSLYDKWAEIVGVSHNVMSSGVINYTLAFATKDFGNTTPTDKGMWKGAATVATSRWKDGAYTRTIYKDGRWKDETIGGNSDYDSAAAQQIYTREYGKLVNIGLYSPLNGGVYQSGWQNWNTGSNRYGYNIGTGSANNNANTFSSVLRTLTGWGR